MKVLLFKADFRSWFGLICSIVTGSSYSHGAIENRDIIYDSTLKYGEFKKAEIIPSDRNIAIINLPEKDCQKWINENLNKKYDLLGLLLWPFKKEDKRKLYCFEVVDEALKSVEIDLDMGKKKSGYLILKGLSDLGYNVKYTTIKEYITEMKNGNI